MSTDKQWFEGLPHETVIAWSRLKTLGPLAWQKIRRHFNNWHLANQSTLIQLQQAGLSAGQVKEFKHCSHNVADEVRLLKKHGINIITPGEAGYPPLLAEIDDPPFWLFYRGSLKVLERPTLTIVGTRKPSDYAKQALRDVLSSSLLAQVTTISGLAYGIDKAVHEASLEANSVTVAVLAGGLDTIYPADHTKLADRILENGGALLSEYPPLDRPQPYKFPVRNRIVAGLSPLTIIIEAKIQSGTLTTAKAALDYNRDIFAVPGDINRALSAGPNLLIKRGATLLDEPDQLLEYYGIQTERPLPPSLDENSIRLLDLVVDRALDLDALVHATGERVESILGLITQLELLGLIYQVEPGKYQRVKR
jgi:DNA processing protein